MPQFGGASEKCSVCSKTVYLAEKIVVEDKDDKKTYHKNCLRCTHCKNTLSLGNYASMNGVMYCKPHFKQLFATKGNYDEGFGKEKLTSKWAPNAAPAAATANSFVPVDKVEEKASEKKDTPSSIASKFQRTSLNSEKCEKCAKAVYATEKIVIEEKDGKKLYHKACLRCTHCQVVLTLGNYAAMGGVTYCKPHLKQLFATKGNYDEGFGGEKHTTKWAPQSNTAPSTFVPVDKTETKTTPAASSTSESVASKFKNISADNKCDKCGKTVYLTEKIVVEDKDDKKLFHKSCLRCEHCQVILSLGNYASMNGVTYCKPHFKQLFAVKGNYDEGFGKEKHTAKWVDKEEETRQEEPRREEPRHEEPRHEEPRHEEPVHEEPRHEEPVHEEPVHEEPVHEEPAREEPAQEEPVHEEPAQEEPRQEEPEPEPVQEEEPVRQEEEPVAEEPVRHEEEHHDHHDHDHDHHDHDHEHHDHDHEHHDHDHDHEHHDHDHEHHDHDHEHHEHGHQEEEPAQVDYEEQPAADDE